MKKLLFLTLLSFASFAFAEAPAVFKKCIACHGADAKKVAPGSKGGVTIAGMAKDELVKELKGYRAKTADNGGAKAIMYGQAANLSDADIEALADYISKLPK
ncbi:cytochrome c553 [Helicobacter cinaedi PAGU611]|uniref:Cytochrome C n=1 Tax=Helicobacter cinaedi CCUG 18818 = ATCC BAA-847 TaxID=537971 RepID=A0AAI8MHU7_9HELI|nr:c-type cytochrome [Helicobacter cinaedi]AWK61318.1 cytochrome C [Helicobacter cinaedi]EFR47123.1 cytochrome C [Helicobacter cinaedi CCUG 18818 = ATCC BAA-847]QOQ90097.1 c-type cytochrome [Helicobacter cinaedi]QOQ96280.1 c-type cytochrome [Helicobacter cinaedi]BAM11776.1 cytochrome c553 [Helicobacter cinaedi PAGU611]